MNKLIEIIEKNTTKPDCKFYNWNDKEIYTSYPREYGARCEKYNEFFYRNADNILEPNCYSCKIYEVYK